MESSTEGIGRRKERWGNRGGPDRPPPRVAVVGCGAISEASHVPSLARHALVRERLILVDRDLARAERLASRVGVSATADDYRDVLTDVDGVVVAVPPLLHVPITLDCLEAGLHVLCEKPLAGSSSEVDQIVERAAVAGLSVGVNNIRRVQPSSQMVKTLLDQGAIGTPTRFEYSQGAKFDWPAATGSYFGLKGSGKGVLSDLGSHVVDLACWWLGGKPDLLSYHDDARGGTEAVARLEFQKDECRGSIHLSWLTRLKNSYRITGDRGTLEGRLYDVNSVTLVNRDGKKRLIRAKRRANVANVIVDSFLAAIQGSGAPAVTARDVAPSIALIEECYGARSLFEMPWYADAAAHQSP